jgi:3-oxoacyl-[acyl-carrier-protein] synthase II
MSQRRRVVCTGIGAVSCFGVGLEAFWNGLTANLTGQAPIQVFDASPYRSKFAAEVSQELRDNRDLFELTGQPKEEATYLATIAAHQAFQDAGLSDRDKSSFGCVVGTLCSGSRSFEKYAKQFVKAPADEAAFPDSEACSVLYQLEHLVRHFKLEGPSSLVSTACSSSTDAIGYAADFIRRGNTNIMLAGGGDILCEMVHAGFNSVFSITRDCPKPFDTERNGFFIGEGAGMLVLEDLEHARARGAHIYAELVGYGLSNTAHHLTATSEDGIGEALAIERCLHDAGIQRAEVDYVNAHGTGTQHNDLSETKALKHVFGEALRGISVTSIKANIGHCMGASGALEAIATIKCIDEGYIPGTLNSSGNIDPDLSVLIGVGAKRQIRYALSESFGFGGASSALLFGAMDADSISA